jgi:hypothetical protein
MVVQSPVFSLENIFEVHFISNSVVQAYALHPGCSSKWKYRFDDSCIRTILVERSCWDLFSMFIANLPALRLLGVDTNFAIMFYELSSNFIQYIKSKARSLYPIVLESDDMGPYVS